MNFKTIYLNDRDEEISQEQWHQELKSLAEQYMDVAHNDNGRELLEEVLVSMFTVYDLFFATEADKQRAMSRFEYACYEQAAEDKGYLRYTKCV